MQEDIIVIKLSPEDAAALKCLLLDMAKEYRYKAEISESFASEITDKLDKKII